MNRIDINQRGSETHRWLPLKMGEWINLWSQLWFLDVNSVIKKIKAEDVCTHEMTQSVACLPKRHARSKQLDGTYSSNLFSLRKGIFREIIKLEKRIFIEMFVIHVTDVSFSLFAAFLSVKLLQGFEFFAQPKSNFDGSSHPMFQIFGNYSSAASEFSWQVMLPVCVMAFTIFFLNSFASALHGQKIEREMLLALRTQKRIASTTLGYILRMTPAKRMRYSTGDLVNLVQNDSRYIGEFFSHACIDFPVLVATVVAILLIMWALVGKAVAVGIAVLALQIPITWIFSRFTTAWHTELMERTDKRLGLINEWIQGARLVRYFGWGKSFQKRIDQLTKLEFQKDVKLKAAFNLTFAISNAWWMVTSLAIVLGMIIFEHPLTVSNVFSAVWFSGILGQQIVPLPWFVKILGEARVASKRFADFFEDPTQLELVTQLENNPPTSQITKPPDELEKLEALKSSKISDESQLLQSIYLDAFEKNTPILCGFRAVNLSYVRVPGEPPVLKNLSFYIEPGTTVAVVGGVGSGKTTLLHLLIGDLISTEGQLSLCLRTDNQSDFELNLCSVLGLEWIGRLSTFVPQEAFVINASVLENVPLEFNDGRGYGHAGAFAVNELENHVMNSLSRASLNLNSETFPSGVKTILGDRGVNLSGGQKQRLSLARADFASQHSLKSLVFLDDPISAVDKSTGQSIVKELLWGSWKNCTVFWITHRLESLNLVDSIMVLGDRTILEQGSYLELTKNRNSALSLLLKAEVS